MVPSVCDGSLCSRDFCFSSCICFLVFGLSVCFIPTGLNLWLIPPGERRELRVGY